VQIRSVKGSADLWMKAAIRAFARQDRPMRWDALFADLEAQAVTFEQAERAAEVEERTRGEVGGLRLVDRARAAVGAPLRLRVQCGFAVAGRLSRVGPDWLLLDEDGGRETVVALHALLSARGFGRYSAVPGSAGIVEARIGLRHVLRGIARDRSAIRVHLTDGTTVHATLDRVGADFIEVATHSAAEPRRRQEVRDVELLPVVAVAAVRRSI
jgi:hypothetical protein